MPGSAEFFGIWKKTDSWDLNSARKSWDSVLEEGNRFLVSPRQDQLEVYEMCSRLLKKLCLFLLISKNLKLKKVNKSFVPEPISSVFGFLCLCLWTLWTFVNVFRICMNMSISHSHIYLCNSSTTVVVLFKPQLHRRVVGSHFSLDD